VANACEAPGTAQGRFVAHEAVEHTGAAGGRWTELQQQVTDTVSCVQQEGGHGVVRSAMHEPWDV
jgi:hypothetical protein